MRTVLPERPSRVIVATKVCRRARDASATAPAARPPWLQETGRFEPPIRSLPAVFGFLGYDPFPPLTTLGERLLHVRRQHGWSTSEVARHIGVDRTTWQNWERDELILFRKHRAQMAKLLGLDPQVLVNEMRTRRNGTHRQWECGES